MTIEELAPFLDDTPLPGGGQPYARLLGLPRHRQPLPPHGPTLETRLRDYVRSRLDDVGWSQRDLAAQLGLSQSEVSLILSGRRHGDPFRIWIKIARALDDMAFPEWLVQVDAGTLSRGRPRRQRRRRAVPAPSASVLERVRRWWRDHVLERAR